MGVIVFATLPLQAVVIDIGDGQGNTTAPIDDFGFGNVGIRGDATAIYLGYFSGQHWVISASHVTAGSIILGGQTYSAIAGSSVQLDDTTSGKKADVILYRITSAPVGLPNLQIATSPITLGQNLVMVGAGRDREVNPTYWNVSGSTWTTVDGLPADHTGYQTISSRSVRWGTNTVSGIQRINLDYNGNETSQYAFRTTFNPGTAQGVYRDSGGGAFYKEGEDWLLAGLTVAVGTETNQPGGSNTAIIGNYTYFVDLSHYSNQIMAIIPEPRAITFIGAFLWMTLCLAVHRRYGQRKDR